MADTHSFTDVYSIIKYVRNNGNSMSVEVHNQAMDRIDEIIHALQVQHDADVARLQADLDTLEAKHDGDVEALTGSITQNVANLNATINALDGRIAQSLADIILKLQGGTVGSDGAITWLVPNNACLGNMNVYSSNGKSILGHTGTETDGDLKVN